MNYEDYVMRTQMLKEWFNSINVEQDMFELIKGVRK